MASPRNPPGCPLMVHISMKKIFRRNHYFWTLKKFAIAAPLKKLLFECNSFGKNCFILKVGFLWGIKGRVNKIKIKWNFPLLGMDPP